MSDGKKEIKIGESLKKFRRDFSLTQKEVSDKIGIMQQAYYRYEADRTLPTVEVIIKIAREFKVSTDYLLGFTNVPRPLNGTDTSDRLIQAAISCRSAIKALNAALDEQESMTNSAAE